MKFTMGMTNDGIFLRLGDEPPERVLPSPTVNQAAPKRCYVYAHYDVAGVPFYIGKGSGRRAWQDDRHILWHRYVKHHLDGKYAVVILADDMTAEEAEQLEGRWITQESDTLVNWNNFGRKTDFAALDQYHKLRNTNLQLIANARQKEKSEPEQAVTMYYQAIENISAYVDIQAERGLVGPLIDEHRKETGNSGELVVLDRITLCLVRLGRVAEAGAVVSKYFSTYHNDEALSGADPIKKRVAKAKPIAEKPSVD